MPALPLWAWAGGQIMGKKTGGVRWRRGCTLKLAAARLNPSSHSSQSRWRNCRGRPASKVRCRSLLGARSRNATTTRWLTSLTAHHLPAADRVANAVASLLPLGRYARAAGGGSVAPAQPAAAADGRLRRSWWRGLGCCCCWHHRRRTARAATRTSR
jgi:hypothetical protein